MHLFSGAAKISLTVVPGCLDDKHNPQNNGCTMYFKKSRTKINFLIKLIAFLLFIYFVVYAFQLRTHVSKYPADVIKIQDVLKNNDHALRHFLEKAARNKLSKECSIPRLKNRIGSTNKSTIPVCQRVPPVQRSCNVAESLFFDKPKGTCSHQKQTQVCRIKGITPDIVCNKGKCEKLHLGTRSVETGDLKWIEVKSADRLQTEIVQLLKTRHNGYCYIRCDQETETYSETDYPDFEQERSNLRNVQLLILPPYVESSKTQKSDKDLINVNFIFIDSVSRHHFFRSLPSTIKLFEEINSESNAVVLDFELVQAVRSRTFESLNSLLGGYVPQGDRTFGMFDMPPEPLKVEGLFGLFRDAGYKTLWLEDLCFEWEWGIPKDLLVHNKSLSTEQTWKNLNKAFNRAGIESFGMSTANCEILSHNGVNDHFHGPDTVCLNGRHQHEYHLEYLRFYQEAMTKSHHPFLTFFETNVGHEDTGRRIQTLDSDLRDYLKFAIKQEKTMTILFSDHGNTYGKFLEKSSEGRVEIYHPSMFIIIPKPLAQQLGLDKMAALTLNQHRLVSHLDLHYTVRSLVTKTTIIPDVNKQYQVTPKGLFESISKSRQCSRVPQIPPNFCICEGGESRMANTSHYVLYAHFAVGVINNAIQSQFRKTHPTTTSGFGRCHRLELMSFQNVRKAVNLDHTTTLTMDILFETADPSYNHYEVFMVSIQSESNSGHMTLNKIDRLSPYSKYTACVDEGIQLQLCICDIKNTNIKNLMPLSDDSITNDDLLMKGDVATVDESMDCLIRITQESQEGFMLSILNVCSSVKFQVTITVTSENMDLSDRRAQQCYLKPGEIRFLLVGVVSDSKSPWDWSTRFEFIPSSWP